MIVLAGSTLVRRTVCKHPSPVLTFLPCALVFALVPVLATY